MKTYYRRHGAKVRKQKKERYDECQFLLYQLSLSIKIFVVLLRASPQPSPKERE
jgi:hypothetical protein